MAIQYNIANPMLNCLQGDYTEDGLSKFDWNVAQTVYNVILYQVISSIH